MLVEQTKSYVAASNAHDLTRIEPMFAADAIYRSSGVGQHEGAPAIIAMMKTFFDANPDVHWDTSSFRVIEENGVEFDFVISLGGNSSTGIERLFFDADNLIRLIEVER
jgi:hypothetical protein